MSEGASSAELEPSLTSDTLTRDALTSPWGSCGVWFLQTVSPLRQSPCLSAECVCECVHTSRFSEEDSRSAACKLDRDPPARSWDTWAWPTDGTNRPLVGPLRRIPPPLTLPEVALSSPPCFKPDPSGAADPTLAWQREGRCSLQAGRETENLVPLFRELEI